jgi:hypothetical protein
VIHCKVSANLYVGGSNATCYWNNFRRFGCSHCIFAGGLRPRNKDNVPVHNYALRHKDVCGSGDIAPRILSLRSSWRCDVSLRPSRFTSGESAPGIHVAEGSVGPRVGMDAVKERTISWLCREWNLDSLVVQPFSDYTI